MPVGLAVEGANRHDKKLAEATLESIPVERPEPTEESPQGMCLDKGYDYDDTRELVREFGFTAHVRARGEEAKALKREAGSEGPPLGGGADPQLDEPVPSDPDPLGEEGGELLRHAALRLCLDHLSMPPAYWDRLLGREYAVYRLSTLDAGTAPICPGAAEHPILIDTHTPTAPDARARSLEDRWPRPKSTSTCRTSSRRSTARSGRPPRAAEPGGRSGPSGHVSADAEDNTIPARTGFHYAETERTVKDDHGEPAVDAQPEAKPGTGSGDQASAQVAVGLKPAATGEDPATEDDYKGDTDDPGTTSVMTADDGKKYAATMAMPIEKLAAEVASRRDGVLAAIANAGGGRQGRPRPHGDGPGRAGRRRRGRQGGRRRGRDGRHDRPGRPRDDRGHGRRGPPRRRPDRHLPPEGRRPVQAGRGRAGPGGDPRRGAPPRADARRRARCRVPGRCRVPAECRVPGRCRATAASRPAWPAQVADEPMAGDVGSPDAAISELLSAMHEVGITPEQLTAMLQGGEAAPPPMEGPDGAPDGGEGGQGPLRRHRQEGRVVPPRGPLGLHRPQVGRPRGPPGPDAPAPGRVPRHPLRPPGAGPVTEGIGDDAHAHEPGRDQRGRPRPRQLGTADQGRRGPAGRGRPGRRLRRPGSPTSPSPWSTTGLESPRPASRRSPSSWPPRPAPSTSWGGSRPARPRPRPGWATPSRRPPPAPAGPRSASRTRSSTRSSP